VIGLEVVCGDEALRYLPLAAATVRDDEIAIASALVLFEERDLAWYRRRATTLRALRGAQVSVGGRARGPLSGLLVEPDGTIPVLLVDARQVPFDDRVTVETRGRESAA
jgi:hypothetical protein